MQLTCPKCQGQMRSYERSGVMVDQCGECRGIFLDRGELEKLVDAEQGWHRAAPSAPPSVEYGGRTAHPGYDYSHRPYKKKKSFLSELFDD